MVSRPLTGTAPTIDLMLAYHRANSSPVVTALLDRIIPLLGPAAQKLHPDINDLSFAKLQEQLKAGAAK